MRNVTATTISSAIKTLEKTSSLTLTSLASLLGSTAKTPNGQRTYLMKIVRDTKPVWHNARLPSLATSKDDYARGKRRRRICRAMEKIEGLEARIAFASKAKTPDLATNDLAGLIGRNNSYMQCKGSWVSSKNRVVVSITNDDTKIEHTRTSSKIWSVNGKWSGTDATRYFTLHESVLEHPELICLGGLVALECEKVAPREYRATWLEGNRELKLVHGYILRGHHIHARTLKSARAKVATIRDAAANMHWAARDGKKLARLSSDATARLLEHTWVGFSDSINAGNCESGTKQFLAKLQSYLGNIEGIRASELLKIRDDRFTRRAVNVAMARYI